MKASRIKWRHSINIYRIGGNTFRFSIKPIRKTVPQNNVEKQVKGTIRNTDKISFSRTLSIDSIDWTVARNFDKTKVQVSKLNDFNAVGQPRKNLFVQGKIDLTSMYYQVNIWTFCIIHCSPKSVYDRLKCKMVRRCTGGESEFIIWYYISFLVEKVVPGNKCSSPKWKWGILI
jgi:hypothetical protein